MNERASQTRLAHRYQPPEQLRYGRSEHSKSLIHSFPTNYSLWHSTIFNTTPSVVDSAV